MQVRLAVKPWWSVFRTLLTWCCLVACLLVGAFGLAFLGSISPSAITIKSLPSILGIMLLGVGSTLAGFMALWNRRAAGILALIAGPVMGLCFHVGHPVAPVTHYLLLPLAVLSPEWPGWMWYETASYSELPSWAAALVVALCGAFWLTSERRGWRPVARTTSGRFGAIASVGLPYCILVLLLGVIVTAKVYAPIGHHGAGEKPPLTHQESPDQTVFTARVFRFGIWRIAIVRQHFWGLPLGSLNSFAFLTFPLRDGLYFVEGIRSEGLLMRFLPVVAFRPGNRSAVLENADANLRVLRDGAPREGIRIIGSVSWIRSEKPIPGVQVSIEGPQGTSIVTTDESGVYDFNGSPGRYSVGLTKQSTDYPRGRCPSYAREDDGYGGKSLTLNYYRDLQPKEIWGCRLLLD